MANVIPSAIPLFNGHTHIPSSHGYPLLRSTSYPLHSFLSSVLGDTESGMLIDFVEMAHSPSLFFLTICYPFCNVCVYHQSLSSFFALLFCSVAAHHEVR